MNGPCLITVNYVINHEHFFVIYQKHVTHTDTGTFLHCRSEEMTFKTVFGIQTFSKNS